MRERSVTQLERHLKEVASAAPSVSISPVAPEGPPAPRVRVIVPRLPGAFIALLLLAPNPGWTEPPATAPASPTAAGEPNGELDPEEAEKEGSADPGDSGRPDPAGDAVEEPDLGPDTTDVELERTLRARFRQIDGLDRIEVAVEARVVTLGGWALSFQVAERAVELAEKTPEVVAVEDRIRIETGLEERVRPALQRSLDRVQDVVSYLPLLLISLLVVAVALGLARLVGRWRSLFSKASGHEFLQDLLRHIVQSAIVLVGILMALEVLGATALVGAVLGAAGVFGLAIGFAFRDLVENYIASVLLSVRQPFAPNDHVIIGEHEGKVMRLTSRATILMTLDGNHLRLPNADVYKGVILNYSRNPKRRFHWDVGVGNEEDLLEAQRLGLDELRTVAGVLDDPGPEAVITGLGDSSVTVRFFGWIDQREASFLKVRAEAIRRVKVALENAGMDLPDPIYRVVLRRQGLREAKVERPRPRPEVAAPGSMAAGEAVDGQIAEERARESGPPDLLDPAAPRE